MAPSFDHVFTDVSRKCDDTLRELGLLGKWENGRFELGGALSRAALNSKQFAAQAEVQAERLRHAREQARERTRRLDDLDREAVALGQRRRSLEAELEREKLSRNVSVDERSLQGKRDGAKARLVDLELKLISLRADLKESTKAATVSGENKSRNSVENLTREMALFKTLGMTFVKRPDNKLRIKFKMIDSENPEREFSFVVQIVDEVYNIESVTPVAVPELAEMVKLLRETNDFGVFTRRLRQKFRDSCTSANN